MRGLRHEKSTTLCRQLCGAGKTGAVPMVPQSGRAAPGALRGVCGGTAGAAAPAAGGEHDPHAEPPLVL
jgi:hypothetical protein